jgi:hypothetical protein
VGPCGSACAPNLTEAGGSCSDGWDNDCDGAIDGADPGCSGCSPGTSGWRNPASDAADTGGDGDGFEVQPSDAYTDGVDYARNMDGAGDRHRFYDYGFAIPAACDVLGITVRADWWMDSDVDTNSISVDLSWDGGVSWTSQQIDNVETTAEHTVVFGGPSFLWGRTWTPSELSDANFRARVTSSSSWHKRDFYLDWIPIEVNYGPTPAWQNTGFVSPTANTALMGGDNDGFELQPDDAMTDGGDYARDMDDGTGYRTVCDTTVRDSHAFYNFGFGLPAGATIGEIEVRTDAWADPSNWDPFLCISLSWDGGTSWTVPKQTPVLTTSEVTYVLGTAETWGRTFAEGELSDANFRVRINPTANDDVTDFFLDWIAVRVNYFE